MNRPCTLMCIQGAPAFGLGVGGVESRQHPDGDKEEEGGPVPCEHLDACKEIGDVALPRLVSMPLRLGMRDQYLPTPPLPFSIREILQDALIRISIGGHAWTAFLLLADHSRDVGSPPPPPPPFTVLPYCTRQTADLSSHLVCAHRLQPGFGWEQALQHENI